MTHMFVYAIILFIFLFFLANNVKGYVVCITNNDCPPRTRLILYKCRNRKCVSYSII
ncbi:Nodule Cysteine-Rich (NCR) secreted peptide [Medicago truncatula]|uniref:Nodule Cysteine-Rich (NCR) secreted peptide n=2 Tax=Medicago truncatula TaxID=3880 RepID=A0A072V4D2_MEDTR|nr:Nodule Cysteine-Rich (NCR) secreted peptide [Medicago truncatula]